MNTERLLQLLLEGVERRVFPGAAFAVGTPNTIAFGSAGNHDLNSNSPAVTTDTVFDLASLTKVVSTTTLAMQAFDLGLLDLNETVVARLPEFSQNGKHAVRLRHLLLHSSGLAPYITPDPEWSPETTRAQVLCQPLEAPVDSRTAYSCLNFITLGFWLETVFGKPLHELFAERVAQPLRLGSTGFLPRPSSRIAPSTAEFLGVVHDPLARALGGVSGNAGLFGTAKDLGIWAQAVLNCQLPNVQPTTLETFRLRQGLPDADRGLGFDTRAITGSSAGTLFARSSFGHTGFTGTSIWIDPENEIFAVLLSNRVFMGDDPEPMKQFRPLFHDLAFELLTNPVTS